MLSLFKLNFTIPYRDICIVLKWELTYRIIKIGDTDGIVENYTHTHTHTHKCTCTNWDDGVNWKVYCFTFRLATYCMIVMLCA